MNQHYEALQTKIKANKEVVGVLGLGYVGLPLAVEFALKKVNVLGFEKNAQKAAKVNAGENYIGDVTEAELKQVAEAGYLKATTDFSKIKDCDVLLICVPTPLDIFQKPDMSFIQASCEDIAKYMKVGTFVALESTTYPTTTEEFILPILEKSGLKQGKDFWLAFSPERVDPGNEKFKTKNTPKVLGAMSKEGLELGKAIYAKAVNNVCAVSSPRAAEMVKILENTYRLVNISLINEMALLCGKMDIDIWEVIEAAKTKPYGYQAFYPGPGIGGHCIPLDPFYLEYVAKKYHFDLTMIHTAGQINTLMPHKMMIKINSALNRQKKSLNASKILFMGVAYKNDIDDERESPALRIMDEVHMKGAVVSYYDPYIPTVETPEGFRYCSVELSDTVISDADCVVFTTSHKVFNVKNIVDKAKLVVDLRNVVTMKSDKVAKL